MQKEVIGDCTLYLGDCRDVLKGMGPGSVDAVVTDPPYGLEFMGKEWDRFVSSGGNAAYKPDADSTSPVKSKFKNGVGTRIGMPRKNPRCKRCGRLSFDHSGRKCECEVPDLDTRTREYANVFAEWCQQWASAVLSVLKPSGYMLCFGGTRTYHRLTCAVEDAGFEVRDCLMWVHAQGFPKSKGCLKPCYEPILLCRKPGKGVLPLSIDECRIPAPGGLTKGGRHVGSAPAPMKRADGVMENRDRSEEHPNGRWPGNLTIGYPEDEYVLRSELTSEQKKEVLKWLHENTEVENTAAGDVSMRIDEATYKRMPPSLQAMFFKLPNPEAEEVLAEFDKYGERSGDSLNRKPRLKRPEQFGYSGPTSQEYNTAGYTDTGSAARFFYCAKASPSDRGEGNNHPTVKPSSLLCWLTKLISQPGETVLDCFIGSGTMGIACVRTGRKFVGVEKHPSYFEIACKRIRAEYAKTPLLTGCDDGKFGD